jgi:2-methylcitrate dehydratase PrpD
MIDRPTITEQLVPILARSISDADRARAALLLLDWTGCAVAGRREPAGEKIAAAFENETGDCSRIGSSKSSVLIAALHNGALGNVLEMDDVDKRAILHAAPTVIPAALAMAEHRKSTAKEFLNAIVIGYEATIRIGRAVGKGHYAFWHNTATCGPFGAAAAACYLHKGSDPVSALGLAGTQAAGLWQTRHEPDSMAKQLHAGHAAHAGVLGAMLSAQGFQGPRSILEGEQGFFAAMCPGADPKDILIDPDAGWVLHETSIKPYPACRHAHPAIDATLLLREQFDPYANQEIIVETYADAIKFCDRPNPETQIEAKFSIQHSVAVTMLKGAPALADFELECINDPKIATLRSKVSVRESNRFNNAYPAHYGARVSCDSGTIVAEDAYGDPEKPMSDKAVCKKAETLMVHSGMTDKQSKELCAQALLLSADAPLKVYAERLP